MAESIVGDLTPADRIDKSEKTLREEVGISLLIWQVTFFCWRVKNVSLLAKG
jgi:hypothetical protein